MLYTLPSAELGPKNATQNAKEHKNHGNSLSNWANSKSTFGKNKMEKSEFSSFTFCIELS